MLEKRSESFIPLPLLCPRFVARAARQAGAIQFAHCRIHVTSSYQGGEKRRFLHPVSPGLLPQKLKDSPQDTRIRTLAILFQEANTLYNTIMTKKANEQPFLQELRHVVPGDLAREAETCGPLTRDSLESLLRMELSRRRRIGHLFDAADRIAGLPPCREDGTGELAGGVRRD